MLPIKLLGVVVGIAFVLALRSPVHHLLIFDLTLLRFVGHWSLGGIRIDPSDVIVGFMAMVVVVKDRSVLSVKKPYFWAWLTLGIFMSASYLMSPENTRNLTSPARIVYQLYRYCWKPILFYPICLMVLRNPTQVRHALMAALVGADACALMAIQQGYSHDIPKGPFVALNAMGGFMIIPSIVALSGSLFPANRFHWIFSGISLAMLARATLFSASRGAMASIAGGAAVFCGLAFLTSAGRKRMFQMVPLALLGVIALFIVRPDILERPAIKHAMSVTEGTKTETMMWRLQLRWPHFFRMALEKPWVGWGTATDESFGEEGNTPHNGFLTMAVKYGFVVPVLYFYFFYRLLRDGLTVFRNTSDANARIFGFTLIGAAFGIMLHNMVDATLTLPLFSKMFWMLCALGSSNVRSLVEQRAQARAAAAAPVIGETLAPGETTAR